MGREVAIKQLPRAFAADPAVRERFVAEARMVASLDHPHIVPVYDFIEHEGVLLLVMELMTGGTLWDRHDEHPLTTNAVCAVGLVMASSLGAANPR